MKKEVNKADFDFEYTGCNFSEKDVVKNGFSLLTGEELQGKIINRRIYGDYPMGYKFVTDIYENGTAEGINNVGSHDLGKWIIDFENNALHLEWKNGWFDTITRAYDVNGNIEFYDVDTGNWRTTFKVFEKWKDES